MEITIESLSTVAGATAAVVILLQGTKRLIDITSLWLRRLAVIAGAVLVVGMSATAIPVGVNVAGFFVAALLTGIVVGLAAGAAFDTIKYGETRTVND